MKLYETDLLKHFQNEWVLDTRFVNAGTLIGIERAFYHLICGPYQVRIASTIDAIADKKNKGKKQLKSPLFKLNGISYLQYGSGSGHVGYFMDQFPGFPIADPHPYEKTDSCIDFVDSLYLSLTFTEKVTRPNESFRRDAAYYWNGTAYWQGDYDTDVGLHVIWRKGKVPEKLQLVQDKLF